MAIAQNPNVLFIGNSYTDANNLPQMVSDVARSMGDNMTFASNTPGGCTFQQHCNNQSMDMIRQGGWDVVVLQEQSQYPSFPQGQVESEVFPYAERLVDSIYANNPCAEPMFYMTWGRKNGDQSNAPYFPVLGTYEGMDSMLCLRYTQMAADNDASLCPVGRVWRYIRTNHPDIELYQGDGSHPSTAGTYVAACAFYTLIFHRNPDSISFDAGLDAEVAQTIRNATKRIVFDSLSRWQRQIPSGTIAQPDSTDTYSIIVFGEHADSLFCDFGDGCDTTIAAGNDTLQHTYADTGIYTVTLVASRHCMSDTISTTIFVTDNGNGIDDIIENKRIIVFPNPAISHITIEWDGKTPDEMTIFDLQGRAVKHQNQLSSPTIFDIRDLPNGTYIIMALLEGKESYKRVSIAR